METRNASRIYLLAAFLWLSCLPCLFARYSHVSTFLTSPLEYRVVGSDDGSSGRLSGEAYESLETATGCNEYAYKSTSGLRKWLSRDPIEEEGGVNLYGFCRNDSLTKFDTDGRFIASHCDICGQWYQGFHNCAGPPPYESYKNESGQKIIKVNKCNVLVFYGHGLASNYRDGSSVDWANLTINDLNKSDVPSRVKNAPCSSAEVFGCNTGNYVKIENPTVGSANPKHEVWGNMKADIDALWQRARAQAKSICQKKETCCDSVTITFEFREPWYQRPSYVFWNLSQTEVVKCK